ncbi:MAG: hypothetical protein NTW16_08430 [Bacteroidetes bacterium]|nr:hypothetical protein [Bacteroidota bacterium]
MMTRIIVLICFILSLCAAASSGQSSENGSLVIVGGGLEPNNKSIFNQMITLAGGAEKASFAVIPSAGGSPVQSYAYFRSELISYGIHPGNIYLIPVAMIDDDSTKEMHGRMVYRRGSVAHDENPDPA